MAQDDSDDVQIIPADQSLLNKVGKANLDKLFSSEAAQKAQKVIAAASDELYQECVDEALRLHSTALLLRVTEQNNQQTLKKIIEIAFAIKTKAGQAGYDLVAALAKSLHVFCEEFREPQVTAAAMKIIDWHESSIKQILAAKMKGSGGETGKAILAEIATFTSGK